MHEREFKAPRGRRWERPDFASAVGGSTSIAGVLRYLSLDVSGANYGMVKRGVRALDLSTAHWTGKGHGKGRNSPRRALEAICVERSTYSNLTRLKKRLLEAGWLVDKCDSCGLKPQWQGQRLVLVLDHVNGVFDDFRRENLRLLCPNCNSQQPTFAGRNKGTKPEWRNR